MKEAPSQEEAEPEAAETEPLEDTPEDSHNPGANPADTQNQEDLWDTRKVDHSGGTPEADHSADNPGAEPWHTPGPDTSPTKQPEQEQRAQ